MFGYIITNAQSLSKENQDRFRGFYCGLCRTLRKRYGLAGSAALSYDMTFLAILLNALYEPGETSEEERCATHPLKRHPYIVSSLTEYAADMNVLLAYHKCLDDWQDDRRLISAAEARLLQSAYEEIRNRYSEKSAAVERWLSSVHEIEKSGREELDALVNGTGRMLGELFVCREEDVWSEELRQIGDGLGRFIYFMDAYDDLESDIRRKRYNPLKTLSRSDDYEEICRASLMIMAGDAARAFETLPIVQDADILRNILYSGIWSRYAYLQERRKAGKGER